MSARVAIPANVRRMIQDIKEIAGNHGDEEVYAVLKECSMDPNETAQRLLFQGFIRRSSFLFAFLGLVCDDFEFGGTEAREWFWVKRD